VHHIAVSARSFDELLAMEANREDYESRPQGDPAKTQRKIAYRITVQANSTPAQIR